MRFPMRMLAMTLIALATCLCLAPCAYADGVLRVHRVADFGGLLGTAACETWLRLWAPIFGGGLGIIIAMRSCTIGDVRRKSAPAGS